MLCGEWKKGCFFVSRKKERKKHHHFSSFKANESNAAEISKNTVFDAESGQSRIGTHSKEYIFASSSLKREKFVCENNRMIQLILFYCIRHAMRHKYQIFSAMSLLPRSAFASAIVYFRLSCSFCSFCLLFCEIVMMKHLVMIIVGKSF